jgi:predicted RNase H-like nuclease (RuvC/YqgF family)
MFWRADVESNELKRENERLKAELEEAKAEIERLNKRLAEKDVDSRTFIDEYINGPEDDRTEVQRWATSNR